MHLEILIYRCAIFCANLTRSGNISVGIELRSAVERNSTSGFHMNSTIGALYVTHTSCCINQHICTCLYSAVYIDICAVCDGQASVFSNHLHLAGFDDIIRFGGCLSTQVRHNQYSVCRYGIVARRECIWLCHENVACYIRVITCVVKGFFQCRETCFCFRDITYILVRQMIINGVVVTLCVLSSAGIYSINIISRRHIITHIRNIIEETALDSHIACTCRLIDR